MIVYSVTINVEEDIHGEWLPFMLQVHIPDVLNTGLFSGYKMFRLLTRFDEETGTTYNVQYYMPDMEAYNRYQDVYAPALQNDLLERFGGKFMAFRTLLEEVV